jgi:outer membrane protein assembly factor BamB
MRTVIRVHVRRVLVVVATLVTLALPTRDFPMPVAATQIMRPPIVHWQFHVNSPVVAPPAMSSGSVIVGDAGGGLHAIDKSTGVPQWSTPGAEGDRIGASPVVTPDRIYVHVIKAAAADELIAFDQAGGRKWGRRFGQNELVWGAPAIDGSSPQPGNVHSTTSEGTLLTTGTSDGVNVPDPQSDAGQFPMASGDTVYVGSRFGAVRAYKSDNSGERWPTGAGVVKGRIGSTPAVAGGNVLVTTAVGDAGTLFALRTDNGSVAREIPLPSAPVGSPFVAAGLVCVVGEDGTVTAFDPTITDPTTGWKVRWQTVVTPPGWSVGTATASTLYLASANGVVHAINAATGDQRWTFDLGGAVTLAADDTAVYAARADGTIFALASGPEPVPTFRGDSARTGVMPGPGPSGASVSGNKLLSTSGSVLASPAVVGGVAYAGDMSGKVYAIDAITGLPRWQTQIEGSNSAITASPAVAAGKVYVVTRKGWLYAFDAATGKCKWHYETNGPFSADPVRSSPAVFNGTVFFGSLDNHLHAVDAVTGGARWRIETGGRVKGSPAVAGGVVYFGSDDGILHAVDVVTGKERWRIAGAFDPGEQTGSPAVAEGVLYYVGRRSVFAVDAATGIPLVGADGALFSTSGAIGDGLLAVSNGLVVVCDASGKLYVGSSQAASTPRVTPLPSAASPAPVVAGNTVYVAHRDGRVSAVDLASGGPAVTFTGGPTTQVAPVPVVINDRVYLGGEGGLFVFASS